MKLTRKEIRNIIWLAYFSRYGFIAVMYLMVWALSRTGGSKLAFTFAIFGMSFLYGLYHLVGLRLKFRHLYCSMQNAYHQKMTPWHSDRFTKKMRKDIRFIGWVFLLMGIFGFVAYYLDI